MYEIRYTKGGEKDYVKVMRSPYADIASGILEQLKADSEADQLGRVCGTVGLRRQLADVEVPSADGAEVVLTACRQHDWSDRQQQTG